MTERAVTEPVVVFLRGVNVGGAGTRLAMAGFRETLAGLGCRDVATHIQSGNAVVRTDLAADALSAAVTAAVTLPDGRHPACLALPLSALAAALAANPFPQADAVPNSLHLVFLDRAVTPDLAALEALRAEGEQFLLTGRVFYLYAPAGIGRSKLARRLQRLLRPAIITARNLATVTAVLGLCREPGR